MGHGWGVGGEDAREMESRGSHGNYYAHCLNGPCQDCLQEASKWVTCTPAPGSTGCPQQRGTEQSAVVKETYSWGTPAWSHPDASSHRSWCHCPPLGPAESETGSFNADVGRHLHTVHRFYLFILENYPGSYVGRWYTVKWLFTLDYILTSFCPIQDVPRELISLNEIIRNFIRKACV